MAPQVLNWRSLVPSKSFRFSANATKGNQHDGFSLNLKVFNPDTETECDFIHQGPEMALPFGFSEKVTGNKVNYRANLSFSGVRYDPQTQKWMGPKDMVDYFVFLQSIDEFNIQYVMDNADTLFPRANKLKEMKGPMKRQMLEEFYFKNVWIGDKCLSGEYAPTLAVKLMVRSEKIATRFFDPHGKEIDFDQISGEQAKGVRCIPLLRSTGLWFAGKNFGMSFQLVQMLLFERENFKGCAIDIGAAMDSARVPYGIQSGREDEADEADAETTEKTKPVAQESQAVVEHFNMM